MPTTKSTRARVLPPSLACPCLRQRVRKARRGHKPSSGTGAGAGDAVNDLNGAKTSVNDTPFLFVRVDPNFMWMRRVEVVQQEVMWKSQLELSDVVGKLEALHALSALPAPRLPPSTTAAALILECLRDTSQRHGFRVRSAAAMALARWQNLHPPRLTPSPVDAVGGPVYESWEGLKWLIHVYKVRSVPWTLPCAFVGNGADSPSHPPSSETVLRSAFGLATRASL